MKNEVGLKKFQEVIKIIPAADILSFVNNLTDGYREYKTTEKEIALIDAKKELCILEIKEKYNLLHEVFNKIFDQRSQSIDKFFEVIDKGLKENDKDLVSIGLKSLCDVVTQSPFSNLEALKELMGSNNIIEI